MITNLWYKNNSPTATAKSKNEKAVAINGNNNTVAEQINNCKHTKENALATIKLAIIDLKSNERSRLFKVDNIEKLLFLNGECALPQVIQEQISNYLTNANRCNQTNVQIVNHIHHASRELIKVLEDHLVK